MACRRRLAISVASSSWVPAKRRRCRPLRALGFWMRIFSVLVTMQLQRLPAMMRMV